MAALDVLIRRAQERDLPSIGRLVRYRPPAEIPGVVRVDTGVYEGGEISMYYDSMIAKLVCHGETRDGAIERMRDALNSFVIRGPASNIAFQSALVAHPRFVSGQFTTAFIAEEYPKGFSPADLVHDNPEFLIAVAAAVHRAYRDRAARIEGQVPGYELKIGDDYFVMGGPTERAVTVRPVQGGCDVQLGEVTHSVRFNWRFVDILMVGTFDGMPFAIQVERRGLKYRLTHRGTQVDFQVLPRRAADLLKMMPRKVPPDLSKFLLSPMPGLLSDVLVKPGQEIKAGERLVIIEAMKMQNVLVAERDSVVAEVLASPGESVAVDQAILRYE
jgi:propionyl-CoA carboxylase alpha chain